MKASFRLWLGKMDRCPLMLATLTTRPALLLWFGYRFASAKGEPCINATVAWRGIYGGLNSFALTSAPKLQIHPPPPDTFKSVYLVHATLPERKNHENVSTITRTKLVSRLRSKEHRHDEKQCVLRRSICNKAIHTRGDAWLNGLATCQHTAVTVDLCPLLGSLLAVHPRRWCVCT